MKTIILLPIFLLLPTLATGQDTYDDIILLGDDDGYSAVSASLVDHVTMNVYVDCPSSPSISGLEMGLQIAGRTNSILTLSFPVGCSGGGSFDDSDPEFFGFSVMFDTPLPSAHRVLAATFDVFYLDFYSIEFRIVGADPTNSDDVIPVYFAESGTDRVPLNPRHNVWFDPCGADFFINSMFSCGNTPVPLACGSVSDVKNSWGTVKSLYR
ncbi:MAG: hypothetical protein AB7V45_13720 [Candidatus Krumholzibacteriia bacterium]